MLNLQLSQKPLQGAMQHPQGGLRPPPSPSRPIPLGPPLAKGDKQTNAEGLSPSARPKQRKSVSLDGRGEVRVTGPSARPNTVTPAQAGIQERDPGHALLPILAGGEQSGDLAAHVRGRALLKNVGVGPP